MTPTSDRTAKLARLHAILERHDARTLVLSSAESLAWLFDGARVSVPLGGAPVLSARVTRSGEVVVTALENEAERLRDEELGPDVEIRSVPWHEPLPGAGEGELSEAVVTEELRAARARLLPLELERYAQLGAETAAAMTRLLSAASPEQSERELAADLARAIVDLGAEPVVLLVAGQDRGGVQHPLPTPATLGRRAMAVMGARRHGLVVNLTRWVTFGGVDAETLDREERLRAVEADAFAATRPGRVLGDVLGDIANAYERHGFGPEAWQRHHQGGPTGYLGRDPKAVPGARQLVAAGQAFAWNPWVPHAKIEDTVVIDDGVRVLTADPAWPTVLVGGVPRPLSLDR